MHRLHYQQALSRSLRPNFDLDFANLQTQKVNNMNTRIRREFKRPKQLAFDTELFGSATHYTNAAATHVHDRNVQSHSENATSVNHPDEQKPHSEILEANRNGR